MPGARERHLPDSTADTMQQLIDAADVDVLAASELRKKSSQILELSEEDFCFFSKEKPLLAVSSSSSITKIAVASWFDGISEGKPIGHGAHRNFNRRPQMFFYRSLPRRTSEISKSQLLRGPSVGTFAPVNPLLIK